MTAAIFVPAVIAIGLLLWQAWVGRNGGRS